MGGSVALLFGAFVATGDGMKRLAALSVAILAASALLATPAVAAKEAPELDRTYLRTGKGTRDLARMMTCLINQNPKLARELFDHQPGSPEYARVSERFFEHGGNCLFMTWHLRTSGLMARGAIAEKLIAEERPTAIVDPPAVSFIRGGGTFLCEWRNLNTEAAQRMVPLADCLVSRHTARVQELLETKPTSPGERKVFNTMASELSACIPEGETVVIQPQILRAAIASAYYLAARASAQEPQDRDA